MVFLSRPRLRSNAAVSSGRRPITDDQAPLHRCQVTAVSTEWCLRHIWYDWWVFWVYKVDFMGFIYGSVGHGNGRRCLLFFGTCFCVLVIYLMFKASKGYWIQVRLQWILKKCLLWDGNEYLQLFIHHTAILPFCLKCFSGSLGGTLVVKVSLKIINLCSFSWRWTLQGWTAFMKRV